MKKIIPVIIVVVLLVVMFLLKDNDKEQNNTILGSEVSLISYNNGNAALGINFLKTETDRNKLSLAIDSNNDGTFADDEWLVEDMLVLAKAGKRNKVYFKAPDPFTGEQSVLVKLNEEEVSKGVTVTMSDVASLLALETVTNPEEAMKGLGIKAAFAQDGLIEITQEDVPDITQQPGECAPTAAANGLISLINQHGDEEDKPASPEELINELKEDMDWTLENGVLPDNFVTGKNLWAARHGLPIRTTKVGDTHGIETIDDIREALENGDSVELRIKFGDASGKAVGGHMVTVTGIHQGDGQTYLDINDPGTPTEEGSETVEVRGNQMTNYGPWEGITVISWGFVETWETPISGGVHLDPMTDAEVEGLIGEFTDQEAQAAIETSFNHVSPGEYSEIYAAVTTISGTEVSLTLSGPGVVGPARQIVVADGNGQAYFTWRIDAYGNYTVTGDSGGTSLNSTVVVN